jgi:hypothetical protein
MSLKIGQEFKDMQRHKKKATLAKCRCKNIYLICQNDQKRGVVVKEITGVEF